MQHSTANRRALTFWKHYQQVGLAAWWLLEWELTPDELTGLRMRVMHLAQLLSQPQKESAG